MTRRPAPGLSRRELIKGLARAGGALLLNSWGCSRGALREATCFQTAGRKVRWIVPFPPGGGYDVYSRLLEPFYQEKIGAEIAVENIPGAGGRVAANTLKSSDPDGLTLGILNAPGLLVASLTGESSAPNPAKDFTILGRVVRNQVVLVTGYSSPFRTIEDVLAEAGRRHILFGISEIGSTNFVNMAVTASLLGIDARFIAGFAGSRETSLAAMRGEVDLSAFTFESILDRVEAQDLRPILQISAKTISPHASLEGVPLLCGEAGLVGGRAAQLGRDARQTEADAQALVNLSQTGLLVAAPPRMDEGLFQCLEQRLHETLTSPAFQAAAARANRSLDVGRAAEAQAYIESAAEQTVRFMPAVREAINKIRE